MRFEHLIVIVVLLMTNGCDQRINQKVEKADSEREKLAALGESWKKTCLDELPNRKTEASKHEKAGRFSDAAAALLPCLALLNDTALTAEFERLEFKDKIKAIKNPRASVVERRAAMLAIESKFPAEVENLKPFFIQIKAAEQNQEKIKKQVLARERKSQGVAIGMSKEEVLASSWGKPKKINTTTTALRTREQWVYDGGYLYFTNELLTSIQN
jgi:hypothetical protein